MVRPTLPEIDAACRLGLIDYAYCSKVSLPVADADSALGWVEDLDKRNTALSATFDPAVYLEVYPDVRPEPIHPIIHYVRHGMIEGRNAFPALAAVLPHCGAADRPIWIESHDLSMTGAPIALGHVLAGWPSLARNAVLGVPCTGPLADGFRQLGCKVVPHAQSVRRIRSLADANALVARSGMLLAASGVKAVLGNSVLSWPLVQAALDARLPTAWIIHEPETVEVSALFSAEVFARIKAALQRVDRLIFVSNGSQAAWDAQDIAQSIVIEKALPPQAPGDRAMGRAAAGCGSNDVLLLSVGSISPRKGQADLMGALDILARTEVGKRLITVLVGYRPSPYAEDIRNQLAVLRQRGHRVFMLPESRTLDDRRKVEHLFAAADIFIMSSRAESLPLTTAEALAAGCPVISTDIPGIAEMVAHGQTGLLYPAGDSQTLAQHIRHLAQSPDIRAQMRNEIAARSNPQAYPDMIKAYRKALTPMATP